MLENAARTRVEPEDDAIGIANATQEQDHAHVSDHTMVNSEC